MNKMTLTLIALAVSSSVQAETTTVATLDVKGEIQIYGNKIIDSEGVAATASDSIDLGKYDTDETRTNGYQYYEAELDGQHHTMTFGYDEDDKFAIEVDATDGKETWKGEWFDRIYDENGASLGFTSKMTSSSGDANFETKCITENKYTTDVSSWPSVVNLGEKISSVDRLNYDQTKTCTTTDLVGEAEPVIKVEEITDQVLLEVYHRTVLLRTSYDVNGYASDDCIVVLRETMWGEQVRTYCMGFGLVELKHTNSDILYQRVNELSSPSLAGDK